MTSARSTIFVRVRDIPDNAHYRMHQNAVVRLAFKAAVDQRPSTAPCVKFYATRRLHFVKALHKQRFVTFDDETSIQSVVLNSADGDEGHVVDKLNQLTESLVSFGEDEVLADANYFTIVVLQVIYLALLLSGNLFAHTSGMGG